MIEAAKRAFYAPQPIARLVVLRILVPLCVLGFLSARIAHADEWIGTRGFHVPDLGGDWRQPVYLPRLVPLASWIFVTILVASALSFAAGLFTRISGLVLAACLVWVGLADRLDALTVTKLTPVLVLALCATPCGARWSIDALRTRARPTLTTWGNVRFFQVLVCGFYLASGICKMRGDWLDRTDVLWTQLHDSYQTSVTLFAANHFPVWSWAVLQIVTLVFEAGAPIWFTLRKTRPFALGYGLAMHLMIGLMFGPVIWFSLLMMTILAACFAPVGRAFGRSPAGTRPPP